MRPGRLPVLIGAAVLVAVAIAVGLWLREPADVGQPHRSAAAPEADLEEQLAAAVVGLPTDARVVVALPFDGEALDEGALDLRHRVLGQLHERGATVVFFDQALPPPTAARIDGGLVLRPHPSAAMAVDPDSDGQFEVIGAGRRSIPAPSATHVWTHHRRGEPMTAAADLPLAGPPRPAEGTGQLDAGDYNVLLIVVDTLRADRLGAWGHDRATSPNLDRLAAGARQYRQAISQAPWTTASIGSLLTSRYPTELGITAEQSPLPSQVETLAERLAAEGYATGAAVSHMFCASAYGFDQGFHWFDESNVFGHVGVSSPGVTELGLQFLEQHADRRFFLWLHYFDPHFAYELHPDHDPEPGVDYAGPVEDGMRYSALQELRASLGPDDVRQLLRLYDSEIASTDAAIGEVLDRLDELGLADDTIVVFTADHGEEFLDHDNLGHSKTVYQELVHVPLIVRCPGWEPEVVEVPVANLDILPTVLDCVGKPVPDGLAGQSLGPSFSPRPVFTETARRRRTVGALSGNLKVVGNVKRQEFEVYDLAADPDEQRDLGVAGVPGAEALAHELQIWDRQLRREARAAPVELDADEADALKALGYLEPE